MKWTPERIKALRRRFDETQDQFRLRFPVSISTIKFWETSGTPPPMACTILDQLEKSVRELQPA